jgi:hypothetical protein
MGNPNKACDNGHSNIEIDWDPASTEEYTCTENVHDNYINGLHDTQCEQTAQRPLHICYPDNITYTEDLPTSGSHRPIWPVYGEYVYVPRQRFIHSLEHGAAVFLYHPCADPEQINEFKAVAENCLRRRIVSPYQRLPPDMNFAILTWKCKLVLSSVNVSLIVDFIKARALKGPENVYRDGQYSAGLIKPTTTVSNLYDNQLCPSLSVLSRPARDFRSKSEARRSLYRRSQENLDELMNNFMRELTD